MNVLASLLATATLFGAAPSAQDQADFAAANEKSLAGDVEGAIALYEDLVVRGVSNEDVLFNLGNNYAHAHRLVDAAAAYERALRLAPLDREAKENLARVRARLHPGQEVKTVAQPVEGVEPLVARIPARFGEVGFAFGWSIFFLAWFLRRRATREWSRRLTSVLVGVGGVVGLSLGLVVAGQEWVRLDERAVVMADAALREGPDARFGEAGRVRAGSRARVLEEDAAWAKIQSDEGVNGWLEARSLHFVDRGLTPKSR